MAEPASAAAAPVPDSAEGAWNPRLALLLAMAMFVLVVDTSLMNVSISAVVHDLGTTVSGVQSAIALEALVSAAFILISSKIGDLIGRRRAYVLGLLGYAVGALAMVLAQTLLPVVIFWAILGGLGASLLLPAMQSLIHGNFEGAAQKRVYALVGASAAIAAAIGPLLGGFVTTFLSWRVGFALELVVIGIVLAGIRLVRDVPYTGDRHLDPVGALLSVLGMGGIVLGHPRVAGRRRGGRHPDPRRRHRARPAVAVAHQPEGPGQGHAVGPGPVQCGDLPSRDQRPDAPEHRARRDDDRAPDLPADGPRATTRSRLACRSRRCPCRCSPWRSWPVAGPPIAARAASSGWASRSLSIGIVVMLPLVPRADSGLWLAIPLIVAGSGLGLLVSQLNNYTLAPISEERISEAAGVNSAAGSFGLSFGLAMAGGVMLATLAFAFTAAAESSTVLSPAEQQQVATGPDR